MTVFVSLLLAMMKFKRPTRTLILCPGTLISTWEEELQAICGDAVRVINANGQNCLSLLIKLRSQPMFPDKPEFWLIGFNRMKTNAPWETAVRYQTRKGPVCSHCGRSLDSFESTPGVFVNEGWMTSKRRLPCPFCTTPLWGNVKDGPRVYAPVLFFKRYLKRHFSFLVADEMQKLKGGETIQGAILGQLAAIIPKTLVLTGTLSGGKASDVFYLLQRAFALNMSKEERSRLLPPYSGLSSFVEQFGTLEKTYRNGSDDMKSGRAWKERVSVREAPGISPLLLRDYFLPYCVFLRISDIADALPAYEEVLEFTDLPSEIQEEYTAFEKTVAEAAKAAMRNKDMTVLGQMVSALLSWSDMPQQEKIITNREGTVVATAAAMPDYELTPKDQRLIEVVREANAQGRKCLIFVEFTGFGALEYLQKRLTDAGCRVLIMKPNVPTEKRLAWIRSKMASGKYDNLLCHPKLVETGLNLLEFPEVLFYQTGYSTFVLRQASRRSWRPGQAQKVVVRFFINRQTFQEKAMILIASKLEAALILEGELSDKGLVALSNGSNGIGELARELLGSTSTESLEKIFASYRATENQSLGVLPVRTPAPELLNLEARTLLRPKPSVRVGELTAVNNSTFIGKIKKQKVHITDAEIQIGKKVYSRDEHFAFLQGMGVLLGTYVLVEEPSLLGQRFGVYLAA